MTNGTTYTFTVAAINAVGTGSESDPSNPVTPEPLATPIPDWPEHYDPFELLTYHLDISEANWNTIRDDETALIEVPALFWATGDEYGYTADAPILTSVRRKSELFGDKVSLKIDLNEYTSGGACTETGGFTNPTCVATWHGLKKLDLENGEGTGVVKEGFANYLHQVAAESFDYVAGKSSWVKLYVHFDGGPPCTRACTSTSSSATSRCS